jgi:hypothetical protein
VGRLHQIRDHPERCSIVAIAVAVVGNTSGTPGGVSQYSGHRLLIGLGRLLLGPDINPVLARRVDTS